MVSNQHEYLTIYYGGGSVDVQVGTLGMSSLLDLTPSSA
jgi:hypothetical protein